MNDDQYQESSNSGHSGEYSGGSSSSHSSSSSEKYAAVEISGDDTEAESPYTIHELAEQGIRRVRASEERDTVRRLFLEGMGPLADRTAVISVHKNAAEPSGFMRAWRAAYRAHASSLAHKRHGESTFADAWYGGPKDDLFGIVRCGFRRRPRGTSSSPERPVHLAAIKYSLDCALKTDVDEGGVRHVMLCRVTLGKMEEVKSDSTQTLPSSSEFDSGVDNLSFPTKYTIWSPFINTHIYPHYIVTFTTNGLEYDLNNTRRMFPGSHWNPFGLLVRTLTKFLDRERMNLILQMHNEFLAHRMTRPQLILRMREIAGDHILKRAIMLNPTNPFRRDF